MAALCEEHGFKVLAYGTLLGGFLTDRWLGRVHAPLVLNSSFVGLRCGRCGNYHHVPLFDFTAKQGPPQSREEANTSSLRKYYGFIRTFGGWDLFQELLGGTFFFLRFLVRAAFINHSPPLFREPPPLLCLPHE